MGINAKRQPSKNMVLQAMIMIITIDASDIFIYIY